jgi:glycosyltransferase involved in cell wall biosynthesis
VPALLADADVLLALSTTPEPFGLSVVEALASGAAVVATAAGGHLESAALADPGAVRLVPIRDPAATAAAILEALPDATSGERRRARRPRIGPFPDQGWSARYAALGRRRGR